MYALVKWCAGVDEGKFSIVHIKYIRNFDLESFLNGVITYEDEFAVEWGVGKRPKGGFPIYMATVQSVGGKFNPNVFLLLCISYTGIKCMG